MRNRNGGVSIVSMVALLATGAESAYGMGGAGPPAWTMTLNYCRQTVTNKGITDVARFNEEVKKCFADPVDYPPAYRQPRW